MFISTNIQIPAVCGTCKMLVMQCRDLLFDNVGRPLTWQQRLRSSCCPKCPFRQQKLRSRQPLVESFRCNLCLFQLCDCSLTCASNVHFNKNPNPCCLWHCKMLVMQCRDFLFDNVGRPLTWRRRLRSSCCPKCPFREQKLRSRQPLVESFRCNLCLLAVQKPAHEI